MNDLKIKQEEEQRRKKLCEKVLKKWFKLHSKNKYVSVVEKGKLKNIPPKKKVDHPQHWNKDIDLQSYYADMEKNML